MNDHKDLATARTPPEIWWNILEYTVGVDHLFADRIDGDEGAAVAWHDYFRTHAYFQQLETAKRQIRAISAVCKSWKQCVDSIASRFLILKAPPKAKWEVEVVAAAQIIYAIANKPLLSDLADKTVQWRVLVTTLDVAKEMPLTTHPHLRRLDLHDRSQRLAPWIFDANKLIYTMTAFLQITWFSYYKSTSYIAMHGKEGPSITLPNLEVLQYHSIGVPCLPHRRLLLPTLRHLTIHITDVHNGYKSLWKSILLGYGSTLRSVSIDLNSTNYTGQFLHKEDFPDWSQVPHLRYLKVTSFASLSFSLLPVTHPLRIFAAEIWDINNLFSCLDSENLQEIRMLSAIWDSSRRCFTRKTSGNSPSLLTTMHQCIDYYTMWRLWEKAASKGIVLRLE